MKLLVYSAKDFEIPYLKKANKKGHRIAFCKEALDSETAINAVGHKVISIFSGDDASVTVLEILWDLGVRYITLRSSGYNNINLKRAKSLGFKVANTPNYSPHAIAEHAVALLLTFNRKLITANTQTHQYNFEQNNLIGFNLHGKTVGIIGTGRIGSIMAKIMHGFGCNILGNDLEPDDDLVENCGVTYTSLDDICRKADIISLHIPLNSRNYQLINKSKFIMMKQNVILINTARGAIVETNALLKALETKNIAGYCTDVYEKEKGIFFKDHSTEGITDEKLIRLLSLPNVLLTPHTGFATEEALENIAQITFENIDDWEEVGICQNELGLELIES